MLQIKEAIVVEGRYDKNTLSQLVDTLILETSGFGIFKNKEQMALLRTVAQRRGLIVLTDSDGAGFVIRNRLKGTIPTQYLKHAYTPDIYGKERRKTAPSKEGKLGVEGMTPEVLREVLLRSGATLLNGESAIESPNLTKSDFMALGLTGCAESAQRRQELLKKLNLPSHMTANGLLAVLNSCYSAQEVEALFQ